MKKILIATDGSDSGHEAVEFGLELADEQGAWAHVVHVTPTVDAMPYSNFGFIAPAMPHEFDDHDYEPLQKAELQAQVQKTVMGMPQHLREILLLSYFHQFPYKQISDILEIPLGTVKSRLHAAVAHFADRWKAAHVGEPKKNLVVGNDSSKDSH